MKKLGTEEFRRLEMRCISAQFSCDFPINFYQTVRISVTNNGPTTVANVYVNIASQRGFTLFVDVSINAGVVET